MYNDYGYERERFNAFHACIRFSLPFFPFFFFFFFFFSFFEERYFHRRHHNVSLLYYISITRIVRHVGQPAHDCGILKATDKVTRHLKMNRSRIIPNVFERVGRAKERRAENTAAHLCEITFEITSRSRG